MAEHAHSAHDDHGHDDHGHGHGHEHVTLTHMGVSVGVATLQVLGLRLMLEVPHEHELEHPHARTEGHDSAHDHGHDHDAHDSDHDHDAHQHGDPGHHHDHGGVRVAERRVFYRRPPVEVPYLDDGQIDIGALGFAILEGGAGSPVLGDGIDSRVAILSGQAAEDHNAYWIGRALADIDYGQFTLLRAGPHLGAVLAAYGGDAVSRSVDPHGESRAVVNVDLGASTVKLAVCQDGEIVETTAISLGTRLVAFDSEGKIKEIRPAAATIAGAAGVTLNVGDKLDASAQQALASQLAECLFNVLERRPLDAVTESLMIGGPLIFKDKMNAVSFTGGGAEYIFETQDRNFGDLGPLIGRAVRQRMNRLGVAVQEPEHLSRAALIGGIQYHVHDAHEKPHFAEPPSFTAARERDQGFLDVGEASEKSLANA